MTDNIFVLDGLQEQIPASGNFTRGDLSMAGLPGGGFVASWTQRDWGTGMPEFDDVFFQLFDASGVPIGSPTIVNSTTSGHQVSSDVAVMSSGDFVVTWQDNDGTDGDAGGIFMQRYNSSGTALGSEVQVNTSSTGNQATPVVVDLSGGGYAIAWVEDVDIGGGSFSTAVKLQKFTNTGATSGSEITVETETSTGSVDFSAPQISELSNGEIAIAYTRYDFSDDAYARLALIDDTNVVVNGAIEPEQTADSAFTLPQTQTVALGNGNVLVAYGYSYSSTGLFGTGYGEVYARIYDATGTAVGSEFAIMTGTANRRFDLFAGSDGDGGAMIGFVQEHDDQNERTLLVQNVSQTGTLIGDPLWIDANANGQNNRGDIAVLSNGDVMMGWQDSGSGARSNLHLQRVVNGDDSRFSSGNDIVSLGAGGENVAALEGDDDVTGGAGDDAIHGGQDNDTLSGGAGADTLQGGTGTDTLNGDAGNDLIYGEDGDDIIDGGTGEDVLDGGMGADTINGGDDADTIFGGYGADTLNGGAGDDLIYALRNADMGPTTPDKDEGISNILNGGDGDDRMYGALGDDTLNGGDGRDIMNGDGQFNVTDGGDDLFIASLGSDILNGNSGIDTADYSGMGGAITANLRLRPDLSFSTIGEVFVEGFGSVSDFDQTLYQIENIIGTAFDDMMIGDEYDNTFDAGAGIDTFSYGNASSGISAYLSFGISRGGAGRDTFVDVENLTGSDHDDRLVGDSTDNVLIGGDGHDIIKGKGGNDTFEGGLGNDRITGDSGDDIMDGGDGENQLYGLGGDDILIGGADLDYIYGGRDSDIINGGGGDDALRGNIGNDTISGDAGADDIRGGGGNDDLDGGDDGDFLFGENGSDILFGGAGNDSMSGGSGGGVGDGFADTFVYADTSSGGGGFDRVKDFEDGSDVIDLTAFGFTNFTTQVATLASTSGSGVRVDFGGGDVLFIESFALADFDASDVILV